MTTIQGGAASAAPSLVAEQYLTEAAEHIAVAESGDAKVAAYHQAAEKIIAAREADLDLTYKTIAARIGKGQTWVRDLEKWHQSCPDGIGLPFARAEGDRRHRHEERKTPTKHEDKVEMATALLEDPKVAKAVAEKPSKAQRTMRNAVTRQNAKERKEAIERETQKAADKAIPLSRALVSIAVKMNDMALAMAGLFDDVAAVPEGHPGRQTLLDATQELIAQAHRWELALESAGDANVLEFPYIDVEARGK